jgi:beta-lactam-binding protein with PASTA domain
MRRLFSLPLVLAISILPAMGQPPTVQGNDDKGRVNLPKQGLVVPNVVETVYKEAIDVLYKAGFNTTANGPQSLSKKIKLKVIKQTPAAGSRAPKDTMVVVDLQ